MGSEGGFERELHHVLAIMSGRVKNPHTRRCWGFWGLRRRLGASWSVNERIQNKDLKTSVVDKNQECCVRQTVRIGDILSGGENIAGPWSNGGVWQRPLSPWKLSPPCHHPPHATSCLSQYFFLGILSKCILISPLLWSYLRNVNGPGFCVCLFPPLSRWTQLMRLNYGARNY